MKGDDEKRLIRLYEEGCTDREIAEALFVSVAHVRNTRRMLGLMTGKGKGSRRMTEECRKKIVDMAKQGMPDEQIAEIVHYAPMYVSEIRLKEGVLRPKTGNRKYSADKIQQLIEEGKTNRQIAKEIGCHTTLASYYRRKMRKNHEID